MSDADPDDATTDRAAGALLGLACGDALGRPVEFETPASIQAEHGRVTEMLGHGTHGQPAGTVTDDTEMALCIARSLVARDGFDPDDVAERFVAWLDAGPFDVGLMTRDAIDELRDGTPPGEAGQAVWERRSEGSNAGNGSLMRCAPHALAYHLDGRLVEVSRESSAITHADPRCAWGCAALNIVLSGLVAGDDPALAANGVVLSINEGDAVREVVAGIKRAVEGDGGPDPEDLSASGYVLDTLETGLYHGLTAPDAETAIVRAVNMGDDADTVGAVTGAVAGARFGASALPERWLEAIDEADELRSLAGELLALEPARP
ncbi:ADP-ribosylglycohydrolase family protein [Haloglomus litoreum]|uniref:ADP-ribosylglycohydrolase family protein n=1 Tax=Haloglomus litoreum TaxID=3034026 RepID=UPI0023E830AD|nr:ADP-ribosylglycohydrolase family protein [Haloglomus sp. DT116]